MAGAVGLRWGSSSSRRTTVKSTEETADRRNASASATEIWLRPLAVPETLSGLMETYRDSRRGPEIYGKGIEDLRSDPALEVDVKLGLLRRRIGFHRRSIHRHRRRRSQTQITARVLDAATKLEAERGRAGVGVDDIDTDAPASRRGVVVMNTPGGNTISTAERAFTLMMSLSPAPSQAHNSVTGGKLKEGRKKLSEASSSTAKPSRAIGMGAGWAPSSPSAAPSTCASWLTIRIWRKAEASALGVELAPTVDDAIREADFITLHMPKTDRDHSSPQCRPDRLHETGVRIINCARGGLIDEVALLAALESGKVAGAALDVLPEEEPPTADYALLKREGVVFTPHPGNINRGSPETVGIEIAKQVRRCCGRWNDRQCGQHAEH